jgi:hypothetical protein
MPEYDLQYYPLVRASTDNAATMQQANWEPPLPYLQSTHAQVQKGTEAARFDAVLEELLRQREIAGELAARQAITKVQQEPAEEAGAAEAETNHLQWSTQSSIPQDRSYTQAHSCSHQGSVG